MVATTTTTRIQSRLSHHHPQRPHRHRHRRRARRDVTPAAVADSNARGERIASTSDVVDDDDDDDARRRALAREIARASPISYTASLADCAYAVATSSATMRVRDRKICALVARAIDAACESGLDDEDGSLLVALALKRAIERNGDDREIHIVVGYAAVTTYDADTGERRREARARAWLDVGGKIVDACAPGLALCEAARRAGVDYDDEDAMTTEFGRETLRASAYVPSIDHSRALVVLGVAVPTGGSVAAASARRAARREGGHGHGLTLRPPPRDIDGAEEAVRRARYYRERVLDGGMMGIERFKDASPPEARACFDAVADAVVETAVSREERIARAARTA